MSAPYEPRLSYSCPDPECCPNGCPNVSCAVCGKDWPCRDYISNHTPQQVEAQHRYVDRKVLGDDEVMLDYRRLQRERSGGKE